MQETIEALIETGSVEEQLADGWKETKKNLDLVKAKKLFDDGCILDAAKLGLPKAQSMVSKCYFHGINGVEKDLTRSLEWAKKAAEGGDRFGQFQYATFYVIGIPGTMSIDIPEAIAWYEKAAKQGCGTSMYNLGCIYVNYNYLQKAASWYEKGANKNYAECMIQIGKFSYKGCGVTKSHKTARDWFEKGIDAIDTESEEWPKVNFWLGKMMVRGEGGSKDFAKGIILIEKAASTGLSIAEECLESMVKVLD